jgi:hypothetical protein
MEKERAELMDKERMELMGNREMAELETFERSHEASSLETTEVDGINAVS